MRKLLAFVVLFAAVLFVAGCFGFNDSTPSNPAQQQSGPVVVPVIQGSDNSGLYVILTVVVVGLIVAVGLAMFERGKSRGGQIATVGQLEHRLKALETGKPYKTEVQRLEEYGYNQQVQTQASYAQQRAINR
jgi:flagellar basal body-associated protein FliL